MPQNQENENRTVKILMFAVLAAVVLIVLWAGNARFRPEERTEAATTGAQNLSAGWRLYIDGAESGAVDLPYHADVPAGTETEIRRVLPELEEEGTAVCFHSQFQSVEVWAGDHLLYRYDSAATRPFGKATPPHWNLVRIPREHSGDELSIRLQSPYRGFSGSLSPVWMGDSLRLAAYLVRYYLPPFLVCGVILAFGAALIVSSFFLRRLLADVCTLRCLGVFVVLASLWMMSEVEFPDILWNSAFVASLARYLLVMSCPVAYLLYLSHRFPPKYRPWLERLCGLMAINFFALCILQLLDIADFPETVWITHLWMMLMIGVVFFMILKRFREEKPVSLCLVFECAGFVILSVTILAEVVLYYQAEYMRSGNYLRHGMFVYIFCLSTAFFLDVYGKQMEADRIGRELQESRLRLMVSQIQPHFVYNTLSSIRTLIRLDPDRAYQLVYDFAKYLRANIDSIGQEGTIPFSQELGHVKTYCGIEQVRFGDKLKLIYEIGADDFSLPPLTVQPLVENAIKHGIRGKAGAGTVRVRSFYKDGYYVVEVLDDGAGFDMKAERPAGSYGLENIRVRLEEVSNARLEISSIPGKGTKAAIYVPKQADGGESGRKKRTEGGAG